MGGDLCSFVLLVRERQCRHDLLSSRGLSFRVVINSLLWYTLDEDEDGKKEGLCWNRFHSIPAAMPAVSMKLVAAIRCHFCALQKSPFRYYSLLNFFGEFPLADKHSLGGRFVGGFIQVGLSHNRVPVIHFGLVR